MYAITVIGAFVAFVLILGLVYLLAKFWFWGVAKLDERQQRKELRQYRLSHPDKP
jgi:hypothetical protein